MRQLVFLLEEKSCRVLLEHVIPKVVSPSAWESKYATFDGKSDLEANIDRKIANWNVPSAKFIVIRDQDAADCKIVKKLLVDRIPRSRLSSSLVRIACREMESWILGDLKAVARAYDDESIAKLASKEKFRNPDRLHRPSSELKKLVPGYQKIDGARRIGPLLDVETNSSSSFQALVKGIKDLVARN